METYAFFGGLCHLTVIVRASENFSSADACTDFKSSFLWGLVMSQGFWGPGRTGARAVRRNRYLCRVLGRVRVGLFTRIWAILLAVDMLVALLTVHLPGGFFTTNGKLPLVLLAAAIGLAVGGPGEVALDRLLAARTRNPTLALLTS